MHFKIKQHIPFYIILLTSLIGMQLNAFCQATANEKVFVHLNQHVLQSGSELKYTAYITNETDTNLSSIVYFELMDCNQISILNWKMNSNNGAVTGVKYIPETIQNGIYYFIAYTNKIRNYPSEAILSLPILIQRIYEDPMDSICIKKEINKAETNSINETVLKNDYLQVEISDSADITLVFNPSKELKTGVLSVSITESSPITSQTLPVLFNHFASESNLVLTKNPCELMPKEKGYSILSGKIINTNDSTPYAKKLIYIAYPDSTLHFNYFITTENGEFCFFLDSNYNNKQLYLQTTNSDCNKANVSWIIDNKNIANQSFVKATNLKLTETEKDYIGQLQKREIINRVYHPSAEKQDMELPINPKNNFFQTPSYIIKPSDYVELTDFQDICDNILPSVRFKVVDHIVQIGMVIDQQIVYDNVLISVNGIPCFNVNYIENLSSKDIKQIEIFNSVLMHGELTFNGVIAIYTHKNSIDEKAFCNPFYTFKNTFSENNLIELTEKDNSLPKVNPNIYWNHSLIIQKNLPTTISIAKPEIGTNYIITINGLINTVTPIGFTHEIKLKQ